VVFPSEEIFERILKEQPDLQSIIQSLTTFSKAVTMIKGGIKENVIPDLCEAVLDIRLLPKQRSETIMKALQKLIEEDLGYVVKDQSNATPKEVFVELEIITDSEGSYWSQWEDSVDLQEFYDLVESVYEKKPYYFLLPASADARYFRNDGFCPQTIIFGPGKGRTAHAVNEHIEIIDFIRAIKVYAIFAYRFLNKK